MSLIRVLIFCLALVQPIMGASQVVGQSANPFSPDAIRLAQIDPEYAGGSPLTVARGATEAPFERLFYSAPYKVLEEGILKTSKLHAIYSYIISNLTTPGFDFVTYLPIEDKRQLYAAVPRTGNYDKKVVTEFIMAKFTHNSKRYQAMITMWGGKKSSLTRIVTLGK